MKEWVASTNGYGHRIQKFRLGTVEVGCIYPYKGDTRNIVFESFLPGAKKTMKASFYNKRDTEELAKAEVERLTAEWLSAAGLSII